MKVAILRPREYLEETILRFRKEGFDVIGVPFVKLEIDADKLNIELDFDALIVTSQTSARILVNTNPNLLKGKKVIAIGKKTAEVLQRCGIRVEIPTKFDSETLYKEFKDELVGLRVLALRSDRGSRILLNLKDFCDFREIKLYSIKFEHGDEQKKFVREVFKNDNSYIIVFSSSMIARSFIELSEKLGFDACNLNQVCIAIGPPTKTVLEKSGINALMPAEYSFDGVIELLKTLSRV
ncbi:uroporphyrinogen-III synthase [Archaeoglobales archaeon]|nr:MAG: uroporphyrinogen-III synthase [Archaeoglobales archaeon]